MRGEPINIRVYKSKQTSSILHDRWEFTSRNWISTLCWRILQKMHCLRNAIEHTATITLYQINPKSVTDAIFKQMVSLDILHIKPKHVYMSYEMLDECLYEARKLDNPFQYINFDIKMGFNQEIYGLPVTVVPHMTGMLVV